MRGENRRFLIILLIALALRLVPVLLLHDLPICLDDMFQYDMLARSIVAGNGYRWYSKEDLGLIQRYVEMEVPAEYDPRGVPTSFRVPGYPAFLALIYATCGAGTHRFFPARLAQALLGATLAPLSMLLARRMGFGERSAQWAAVFIAIFPLLIAYPMALASENLFLPLLTLTLILVLRAGERGQARDYALAGLVLGLTTLTRSIAAGFVPLAALWLWWIAQEKRAALHNTVVLILCFLLITVPWAVRNTCLHGRLTWVETSLGYNLYVGYHPLSTGTFQYGISLDLLTILDDGERNVRGMEAFWRFVRANPGRVPYLMLRKARYLWESDSRPLIYFYASGYLGRWPGWLLGLAFLLICGPLAVLAPAAAVGLTCGPMGRRKALPALLLFYYTGVHMLIMSEPRFHAPLLPVIAVLATYAFVERPWRESRRWQRGLAVSLIALMLVNWGLEVTRNWDVLVQLFGPEGHRLHMPY
jgi:4-amino-4-deoxy-L-arabinose transferase-like glycosyltransferase